MNNYTLQVIILAIALSGLSSGCTASQSASDSSQKLLDVAKDLVQVISRKETEKIGNFLENKASSYDEKGKLDALTFDYIFEGRMLSKSFSPNTRPIIKILQEGEITYKIVSEAPDHSTVYFIPRKFYAESKVQPKFFKENFMVKYFACDFYKTSSGWKMKYNFCFSETEGPFPTDY